MGVPIRVDEPVRRLGAFLAVGEVRGVEVGPSGSEFDAREREVVERVSSTFALETVRENPKIAALRSFYWRIGVDPTKTRPSSEALLRRVLRGGRLPRINNVVDAGNLASLSTLIPIGLYDESRLEPPLELRLASPGEEFFPIGGRRSGLRGGEVVLADAEKVIHLFPHRDSALTSMGQDTRDVLVVACGVPGIDPVEVSRAADLAAGLISDLAGGSPGSGVRVIG